MSRRAGGPAKKAIIRSVCAGAVVLGGLLPATALAVPVNREGRATVTRTTLDL